MRSLATRERFEKGDERARALAKTATVSEFEIRLEHRVVLRMRRFERGTKLRAIDADNPGGGQFEQTLRTARHTEAAALASPERHAGVSAGNDHVIDGNHADIQPIGHRTRRGFIA